MNTPNKNSYESALKTVKAFEKRQADLNKLDRDLGHKLKQFSQFKFKVNKRDNEIIFTGVMKNGNKLVLGQSKCKLSDKFEPSIGKMLAVQKSLHEDVSETLKLVEPCLCVSNTRYVGIDTIGTLSGLNWLNPNA